VIDRVGDCRTGSDNANFADALGAQRIDLVVVLTSMSRTSAFTGT
jgi:hypothetical protein